MSIECVKKQNIKRARKDHICNYCGETIEAGSPYTREFLVNGGEHYEWLMHNECEKVANEIWEFVDPWDGMTDDDYQEGVRNLFECFICGKCDNRKDCALHYHDDTPCKIDWFETYKQTLKLHEIFETKCLVQKRRGEFGDTYYALEDRREPNDSGV